MPDIPLSVGSKLELLRAFVFAKFPYTSPYTHDLSAYAYCPCIILCYRPIPCIYMTEAPRVLHFSAFIPTAVSLPQKPLVSVSNRGTTTLLLSIDSLPEENYQVCVFWEKTYPLCSYTNESNCRIISYRFSIDGLDEGSSYSITVMVTNAAGKDTSDPLNTVTLETGIS